MSGIQLDGCTLECLNTNCISTSPFFGGYGATLLFWGIGGARSIVLGGSIQLLNQRSDSTTYLGIMALRFCSGVLGEHVQSSWAEAFNFSTSDVRRTSDSTSEATQLLIKNKKGCLQEPIQRRRLFEHYVNSL